MSTVGERNTMPSVGPRFFREAGEVMFEFVIDPGNIVGPRPATKADSEKHPSAWSMFVRGEEPEETAPAELPARTLVEVQPEMVAAFERLEADRQPPQPAPARPRRKGPR